MSETGLREPNRRTVSKGIAWSVPIISAAAVAPFAAASPTKCVSLLNPTTQTPTGCVSGHSVLAKVDHKSNVSADLEYYVRFQIPAGVTLTSGQTVTFTFTVSGVTLSSISVASTSADFSFVASAVVAGQITVTATVKSGSTATSGEEGSFTFKAFADGFSTLNTSSFTMTGTSTHGASGCSVYNPYNRSIIFYGGETETTALAAKVCKTGNSANAEFYHYI